MKLLSISALVLCCTLVNGSSLRGFHWWSDDNNEQWAMSPPNASDSDGSYWIGRQNLLCVLGVQGREALENLNRVKRSADKFPLEIAHSILWYRGLIYEWGTGDELYHVGKVPASHECKIKWEQGSAGNSTCQHGILKYFTEYYSDSFGPYNVLTNNCHTYVNRLSAILDSATCTSPPASSWAASARSFWKFLGDLLEGRIVLPELRLPRIDIKKLFGLGDPERLEIQ